MSIMDITGAFYSVNPNPNTGNYLCFNLNESGLANGVPVADFSYAQGPSDFRIASEDGGEFRFVSMFVDCGGWDYDPADPDYNISPTTIKGYRDNAEVASANITGFSTNGPFGTGDNTINYEHIVWEEWESGGGTLYFTGANWHNIDEIRITNTISLVLIVDDLEFAPALTVTPVTWISVNARRANDEIVIFWKTAQELNTDHYIIERSDDGRSFTAAGKLWSQNANTGAAYSFTDKSAGKVNTLFYRIRQVDRDGQSSYSQTVKVPGYQTQVPEITLLSNPFDNRLGFDYQAVAAGQVTISLFNSSGRLCISQKKNTKAGRNNFWLPTNRLPAGIYLLRISDGRHSVSVQVIKK